MEIVGFILCLVFGTILLFAGLAVLGYVVNEDKEHPSYSGLIAGLVFSGFAVWILTIHWFVVNYDIVRVG